MEATQAVHNADPAKIGHIQNKDRKCFNVSNPTLLVHRRIHPLEGEEQEKKTSEGRRMDHPDRMRRATTRAVQSEGDCSAFQNLENLRLRSTQPSVFFLSTWADPR